MSTNQKGAAPAPAGGSAGPQQRYTYAPVPPQHNRNEGGFQINAPTGNYVQQQTQPGNQGPQLRNLPPNGSPNQASTPPTNELKVQSVPQQQLNHMQVYSQQPSVQRSQSHFYNRNSTGSTSQTARMPNHQQRNQPPIYQTQPPFTMPIAQVYTPVPQFYSTPQRPQGYVTTPFIVPTNLQNTAQYYQFANQNSPSVFNTFGSYIPINMQPRSGHPQQPPAATPPNTSQPITNLPINQPAPPQTSLQSRRPRTNAISIVDPETMEPIDLSDVTDRSESHPPSGESSARQTPQPSVPPNKKDIQPGAFDYHQQHPQHQPTPQQPPPQLPPQQQQQQQLQQQLQHQQQQQPQPPSRIDHMVQPSNLKAEAKEFISSSSSSSNVITNNNNNNNSNLTAKETTPVVSANIDAVEVTLVKKERESPAKIKKQQREHKESFNKDVTSTSSSINNKDETKKDDKLYTTAKEEKKRKDYKNAETKSNSIDASDSNIVQQNIVVESCSAKNKQNASQRGNKQQQQPQQQQQQQQQPQQPINQQQQQQKHQAAPSVPQPQPPKPNNKTNRKNEINQKGASKEGTDMDAFNDSSKLDAINANVNNNDLINANSLSSNTSSTVTNTTTTTTTGTTVVQQPTQSSSATPAVITTQNIINSEKKIINNNGNTELNNIPTTQVTIKQQQQQQQPLAQPQQQTTIITPTPTAMKTLPKNKVDVTSIVKDIKPKELKHIPTPMESQDEPDKALISNNDKLVQAKNEANTKASETQSVIDSNKSDLPYVKGQWTPDNQGGKKQYERDFLLALRDFPSSKKRPEFPILDVISADEGKRLSDGRYSTGGRTDLSTPPFSSYGSKSGSQRGIPPKRSSQSGKVGSGSKGNKPQVIKVSLSVREDVKLNETENAWRPARFIKGENMTEDDKKTQELYKNVRGVLNKLTPQKFDTLITQVRQLQIDTEERLQGVIDLVFEKAVDEPNFSVAYAYMCKELCYMAVPTSTSTEEKPENVNFRKLLITRCQVEFEKQSVDESVRNEKLKEIEDCTDPEKKKELQFDLEEYDRRLRMKSVGNIRFIGELFKQGMLTVSIMIRCLNNLLDNKDEESLECLCKLLTTIGKEMESKGVNLSSIFNIMKEIVDKKHGRVSSRVRFMLQDVIDLRKNKWIPRRQDLNPKTIDQIQKEAENEQLNIQAMNSGPIQSRKDERGTPGPSTDRKRARNVSDDGWQTQSRTHKQQFTVQSDKLKSKVPVDEPLGSKAMFGNWSKGSGFKNDSGTTPTNTANIYAALENMDPEKRSIGPRSSGSKEPYNSKGTSLERAPHNKPSYNDGRGSRSGSQHRSNDSSASSSQRSTPSSIITPLPTPASVQAAISKPNLGATIQIKQLTEEQLVRRVENNLDEYINDSCTVDDYNQDTILCVPVPYHQRMVSDGFLHVLERSATARLKTGGLFAELIQLGTLSIDSYCAGLEEILRQAEDLIIDIPKFWDYLAEILVHVICTEALPLKRLHKCCEDALVIQNSFGQILLARLFYLIITEKGPAFLQKLWQQSGLQLCDFMLQSQVDNFIKNNKFDFMCGGDTIPCDQGPLSYEHIHSKLIEFFKSRHSLDEIVTWITANVGDRISEKKFIRTLATAIFEFSVVNNKLLPEKLKDKYNLLMKYVDNKPEYELQCLYALQTFSHKLEHPQGLLLSLCERFYEDSVFSQDSFIAWETSTDPAEQEGKGVAIKQLTSFFTQLKENEEDDEDESEEDT